MFILNLSEKNCFLNSENLVTRRTRTIKIKVWSHAHFMVFLAKNNIEGANKAGVLGFFLINLNLEILHLRSKA